jgi:transcription elongation GreA/GreB family factor
MARYAALPQHRAMLTTPPLQATPITAGGHRALRLELESLRRPGGPPEEHLERERRITEIETTLAMVYVVEPPADGSAGVGSLVEVHISGAATACRYRLVGPVEADSARGDISVESPIGSALVGRRAGDTVEVVTPGGPRTVAVLQVGGYL